MATNIVVFIQCVLVVVSLRGHTDRYSRGQVGDNDVHRCNEWTNCRQIAEARSLVNGLKTLIMAIGALLTSNVQIAGVLWIVDMGS